MERISINAGKTRRERFQGRDYLVAPLTMIVPGVLNGSKGALYYPSDEVANSADSWNGMPIVVNHPEDESGSPISARDPEVLNRQGIGMVLRSKHDGKLRAEGWFDIEMTKKVNKNILSQLENNRTIELSTGLFTDNEERRGQFNGRHFDFVARNYRPDHLAILPNQVGACSVSDGCGVLVNRSNDLDSKLMDLLGNEFSPEARAAAIEARKRKSKDVPDDIQQQLLARAQAKRAARHGRMRAKGKQPLDKVRQSITGENKPKPPSNSPDAKGEASGAEGKSKYGMRHNPEDGEKGEGFLGAQKSKDGDNMTEVSVGVEIDGKERDIPTLVPGLTKDEVKYITDGGDPAKNDSIMKKAEDHAKKRIAAGKSPFADKEEEGKSKVDNALLIDLADNYNSKGCNQYTGPGCAGPGKPGRGQKGKMAKAKKERENAKKEVASKGAKKETQVKEKGRVKKQSEFEKAEDRHAKKAGFKDRKDMLAFEKASARQDKKEKDEGYQFVALDKSPIEGKEPIWDAEEEARTPIMDDDPPEAPARSPIMDEEEPFHEVTEFESDAPAPSPATETHEKAPAEIDPFASFRNDDRTDDDLDRALEEIAQMAKKAKESRPKKSFLNRLRTFFSGHPLSSPTGNNMSLNFLLLELVGNANPEGCNQYKACGAGGGASGVKKGDDGTYQIPGRVAATGADIASRANAADNEWEHLSGSLVSAQDKARGKSPSGPLAKKAKEIAKKEGEAKKVSRELQQAAQAFEKEHGVNPVHAWEAHHDRAWPNYRAVGSVSHTPERKGFKSDNVTDLTKGDWSEADKKRWRESNDDDATENRKQTRNAAGNNSTTTINLKETIMSRKLTQDERKKVIGALVGNCECEDKEKEAAALNQLSDKSLARLHLNAFPPAREEEEEEEVEEEEEEMPAKGGGGSCGATTNAAPTKLNFKEWSKTQPPEVVRLVANSMRAEQAEKVTLIKQIVANKSNQFKPEQLKSMSVDMLRPIAALAHNQKSEYDDLDFGIGGGADYLGAGLAVNEGVVDNSTNEVEGLALPSLMFDNN